MAKALEDLLAERITGGVLVVKEGHGLPLKRVRIFDGGHPVPDERGVRGTEEILAVAEEAGEHDLLICLISGGGSALLIAPPEGVPLKDKQEATKFLLACGATIHELNTVRKHLSRSKGGRLAHLAHPATVVSLILSDVVGDDLDVIGSGPTVPDSTTFQQTEQILKRYGVWDDLAVSIQDHVLKGVRGILEDTPKSGDVAFERCSAVLVGTNLQAMLAAAKEAERRGYQPLILSTKVEGEAREVAKVHAAIAKEVVSSKHPISAPACLLFGGETTVTLQGSGQGGRNQEYALAAALYPKVYCNATASYQKFYHLFVDHVDPCTYRPLYIQLFDHTAEFFQPMFIIRECVIDKVESVFFCFQLVVPFNEPFHFLNAFVI